MRKEIVNSTPLITLCKIDSLHLLKQRYEEIMIPEAVLSEVTAKNDSVRDMILANRDWIHIEPITNVVDKKMYRAKLHDGEVEVMILAQETKADLVVIDDGPARKTAEYLDLTLTGTIGILIKSKQAGDIPAVMPLVDAMLRQGIYLKPDLIEKVKRITGE